MIPAVHVMIYDVSFIISKVIRQLVHRSSCGSVSRTAAFTHVHTVQLNTLLHYYYYARLTASFPRQPG